MTFAEDIEQAAGGKEKIEAVVIGGFGWAHGSLSDGPGEDEPYGIKPYQRIPLDKKGAILSWDEARPLLDYAYDRGFGAPDCHAVYVWTDDKVIWVTEYDGSTSLDEAPRNPIPCTPEMPGGG